MAYSSTVQFKGNYFTHTIIAAIALERRMNDFKF